MGRKKKDGSTNKRERLAGDIQITFASMRRLPESWAMTKKPDLFWKFVRRLTVVHLYITKNADF